MNITLDDASPQLQYISSNYTWLTDHTDDGATPQYFDGTFHGTFTEGDAVSLTFNGSSVFVFGARRPNHGIYTARIDGGNDQIFSGQGDNLLHSLLFQATGLSNTQSHTVVLTNRPSMTSPAPNATIQWWLDVDYVVITTAMTGKIFTTTVDDKSTAVVYGGGNSGWINGNSPGYFNDSIHSTTTIGDRMSLRFNGSSIQLFGGVGVEHGNYSVSLDNGTAQIFNGSAFASQTQVSLYTANNLTEGPHIVSLTNVAPGHTGSKLDFDYAVVNSTIDPSGSRNSTINGTTTSSSNTDSSPSSSSGVNGGVIGGAVGGGVVGLALIVFGIWWFLRKRKARARSESREPLDLNGEEVKPFPLEGNDDPASTSASNSASTSNHTVPENSNQGVMSSLDYSDHNSRPPSAREPDQSRVPFLTNVPPPPPSNNTSYPRSAPSEGNEPYNSGTEFRGPFGYLTESNLGEGTENGRNRFDGGSGHQAGSRSTGTGDGTDTGSRSAPSIGTATSPLPATVISTPPPVVRQDGDRDGGGDGDRDRRFPSTIVTQTKSLGVTLPYTARSPFNSSTTTLSSSPTVVSRNEHHGYSDLGRMIVPGREVDIGPLLPDGGDGHIHDTLPPDYHQATEPLPGQRA